jgi:hypothetical protein
VSRYSRAFYALVPSWLSSGDGEKVLFALGELKDAFVERVRQSLEARFPSRAGESALALIGADRGLFRGRTETAAHYAARLIAWRYPRGHRVRGNALALLEQVWNYFGGMRVRTIDVRGNVYELAEADVESETVTHGAAWNWDGAPVAPRWGRFWLLLFPSSVHEITPWPKFGDGGWGGTCAENEAAGRTVGQQGITPDDAFAIRTRLLRGRPWYPLGTKPQWVVVTFDGDAEPAPDGNWQSYKGRDSTHRYWRMRK